MVAADVEKKGPTLDWEKRVGFPKILVVGVDEVGRGCLAGPVVAGAVLLPAEIDFGKDPWLREITDSKALTPEARQRLVPLIEGWARACGIGSASVEEIDRINIFHAAHLAMTRAIEALAVAPEHVLVDGKFLPRKLPCKGTAIVKGDFQCLSVAAASILAKVWRDRLMVELDAKYPGYGFGAHKGYSTPAHLEALKRLGACEIHRRSFSPVAEVLGISAGATAQLQLFKQG